MKINKYVIGIVIIIIIIILLCLFFLYYSKKSIRDHPFAPDKSEKIPEDFIKGELYSSCVNNKCQEGLVCDRGICKQISGSSCVISSSCQNDNICYMERCTLQPNTQEELKKTNYNQGKICVNRHFLKLNKDSFIMLSGWWNINNGIYICDSNITGLIYIVNGDGLFRISSDPSITDVVSISQKLVIAKIFRYLDKIHVLTEDGYLYQLINESTSNKWEYKQVTELYKKKLISYFIEDIYPCKNGTISIKISGKIYSYCINEKTWKEELGNPLKIIYGEIDTHKIILYKHKIEYYFYLHPGSEENRNNKTQDLFEEWPINQKSSNVRLPFRESVRSTDHKSASDQSQNMLIKYILNGSFKDIEFNLTMNSIIAISDNKIKEYEPVVWIPIINNQNHFKEISLKGIGDKLIRTKESVWLLTGVSCSSI